VRLMSNEANLLVFRETKTQVSTQELVQELSEKVAAGLGSRQAVMDALIRAGELECAFSDANASGTKIVTALTDHLAALLVSPNSEAFSRIQEAKDRIRDLLLPETVVTSPPEGFAYYALHPTDFADSAIRFVRASKIAVIGIRSIGTTLSAVVSAALNAQGYFATRTTVRPTGHPYNRQTRFSDEQLQSIRADDMRSGHFVVVDEGPGLSGSSFLSVGEALIAQGIGPDRITLIGTRDPDPDKLYASNGRDRWSRFRHVTISPQFYGGMPQGTSLSGGAWRELFLGSERAWPPCWPQMERLKFLSSDGKSVLKFDGLGRFGERVRERANCICSAGLGPQVEDVGDGVSAYRFICGRPLTRSDLSVSLIERIARYCAVRAIEFKVSVSSQAAIAEMVRHNLGQELNLDWYPEPEIFASPVSIVTDGRMQPEEWIATTEGEVLKVDAGTHGDDHFLPGPIDIAWDLAGAIVEWDLLRDAQHMLVAEYYRLTGDDPTKRLPAFVIAYNVFRLAYCKMAQLAMRGSAEEQRWLCAYKVYLERLNGQIRSGKCLQQSMAI
jgi:hypothetical protein